MSKNTIRGIAVLAILLVVFSVFAFAVPFEKTAVFWLSYVFAVISVAVQGYALYAGFVKGDPVRSKLYGFPIARLGTLYMVFQLAASLLFMALAPWMPLWIAVILYTAALAFAAIGMISAEAVREEIEVQDAKLRKEVKTIRGLQSKARSLAGLCEDAQTAAILQAFSDELRYSDPVSSDALTDIENELSALVADMEKAVIDADYSAAKALSRKAAAVLNERNRLCKLSKQ